MRNKPVILFVFAGLQALVPVFSLVFNATLLNMSPVTYTQAFIASGTTTELLEFFLFYPAAAIAIVAMKPWTYPIYLTVAGWTTWTNYLVWQMDYSHSIGALIGANAFNILSIAYFAHPKVRRVFFDQRVKWWETAPRYQAQINEAVINKDIRQQCEIVNLSEGGALVKTEWQPEVGEHLQIHFELADQSFDVDAEVMHTREQGFGVQFRLDTKGKPWNADQFGKVLTKSNLPLVSEPMGFAKSLQEWTTSIKRGEGFLPSV